MDDDYRCRELQRECLERCGHFSCAGSFPSADAALAELGKVPPPDLVIMDVNMPGTSGIQAIPLMRALAPGVRIFLNSVFTNPEDHRAALAAGASAYLSKCASAEEWLAAIEQSMRLPVPVSLTAAGAAPPGMVTRPGWLQTLQTKFMDIVGR